MPRTVSYEIYSFKNGNWMLDSVHDDKNMAIHQGRLLIASPHHMAIRVVEESYDEETDNATSKIVYKEQKGKDDVKRAAPSRKKAPAKGVKTKKKKKKSGSKNLMILVFSVCGIGIGLLAFLALLIAQFG